LNICKNFIFGEKENDYHTKKSNEFSVVDVEETIVEMLSNYALNRENNGFFKVSREKRAISLQGAIKIAWHWREMTKKFMFTVMASVGVLAEEISKLESPPYYLIDVLQTSVAVISDDLSNVFSTLKEVAPQGPAGAHYIWWEESVFNVFYEQVKNKNIPFKKEIAPGVNKLLQCMEKLSKHRFGAAIQLRVVEAIALNIVLSYRYLFSSMEMDGKKLFPHANSLAWINAHIKAEVVHHQKVTDQSTGVGYIANNLDEKYELLSLTKEYVICWVEALNEFEKIVYEKDISGIHGDFPKNIENTIVSNNQINNKKWRCIVCDFIYDESLGWPEEGILPGTAFADIPDDWRCPDCGVGKADFILLA
jgi:rubredoxin